MSHDIGVLILATQKILDIKLPIRFVMKTKGVGESKDLAGYCETHYRKGKMIRHKISLNLDVCLFAEYKLNDVIVHEMVHACMFEHGSFNEKYHHDIRFQNICALLRLELQKMGFDIGELYNANVDLD